MKALPGVLAFVALTCLPGPAVAGKPVSGGGTPSQILPVSLGTSSNCTGSYGLGINDGGIYPLQVVAQGSGCANSQPRALLWSQGTGMVDLGLIGGGKGAGAEDVANDGTVAGWIGGGVGLAFVRPLGGPMQELPKLPGMDYASSYGISPDGRFIVGSSSKDPDWYWVRWERFTGDWRATSIPSGGAAAVSNAGAVIGSQPVAGSATERRASIWTEQGTVVLPGIDTYPNDINAAGTVVVGFRWQPCPSPCGKYEVPMVWTLRNGAWTAQELQALDGVDSEASAVAEVNGQVIIVGYGYTKKDAVMRAVVWRPDAQGNYGAPMRLGALDGRSSAWARAQDVNSRGQVVGTSAGSGLSRFAVMWQLP